MDFSLTPEHTARQERTRAFIRDRVMHGPEESLRQELQALARAEGLLAPHVSREYGGPGLSHVGKAVVFEEAGYSLLGYFGTDLTAGMIANPAMSARLLGATPMGRFGRDADIVGAAVFLAGPASQYVTGQSLPVDGGYVAA